MSIPEDGVTVASGRIAVMRTRMLLLGLVFGLTAASARTQEIDWDAVTEEAVSTLREYIRFDTTVPPGDVRGSADFLQEILEREGLPVTRFEPGPGKVNLFARIESATAEPAHKPILLLHHMDVVPADASRWGDVDPFGGELSDGYIWGRGAMDMKGTGTMHLMAFLTLKRQNVALDRDVILMAVADEEIAGPLGARYMVDNHYDALDPEYVLDEGGFGSREMYAEDKLVFSISVAEKQVVWLKIRAEGVSGHGSQPNADNPNDRLVRALGRLLDAPFPSSPSPVVRALRETLGTLAENKFTNAIQNTTLSLTSLQSGVGSPPKINVIPSVAEATIDCRLIPGTDASEFIEEVKAGLGDDGLTVEVALVGEESVVTPHDTPLYRALASAIVRHNPEATVVASLIPYGTDSNVFRHRGALSYGLLPMVLTASIVSSMHSDAERIPVSEVEKAIRIFYEALIQVAGT